MSATGRSLAAMVDAPREILVLSASGGISCAGPSRETATNTRKPKKGRAPWGLDKADELRQLIADGKGSLEIATKFNIHQRTVQTALRLLGLWQPEHRVKQGFQSWEKDEIQRLFLEGMNGKQIALKLNYNMSRTNKAIRKLGLRSKDSTQSTAVPQSTAMSPSTPAQDLTAIISKPTPVARPFFLFPGELIPTWLERLRFNQQGYGQSEARAERAKRMRSSQETGVGPKAPAERSKRKRSTQESDVGPAHAKIWLPRTVSLQEYIKRLQDPNSPSAGLGEYLTQQYNECGGLCPEVRQFAIEAASAELREVRPKDFRSTRLRSQCYSKTMQDATTKMQCQVVLWDLLTHLGYDLPPPQLLNGGDYDRQDMDGIFEQLEAIPAFWETGWNVFGRSSPKNMADSALFAFVDHLKRNDARCPRLVCQFNSCGVEGHIHPAYPRQFTMKLVFMIGAGYATVSDLELYNHGATVSHLNGLAFDVSSRSGLLEALLDNISRVQCHSFRLPDGSRHECEHAEGSVAYWNEDHDTYGRIQYVLDQCYELRRRVHDALTKPRVRVCKLCGGTFDGLIREFRAHVLEHPNVLSLLGRHRTLFDEEGRYREYTNPGAAQSSFVEVIEVGEGLYLNIDNLRPSPFTRGSQEEPDRALLQESLLGVAVRSNDEEQARWAGHDHDLDDCDYDMCYNDRYSDDEEDTEDDDATEEQGQEAGEQAVSPFEEYRPTILPVPAGSWSGDDDGCGVAVMPIAGNSYPPMPS